MWTLEDIEVSTEVNQLLKLARVVPIFLSKIMNSTLRSNPMPSLPGSGLETNLSHQHNGVMTYSAYVNGSIFSVPKVSVNTVNTKDKHCHHNPKDHLVDTVYGLVKYFLG